MGEGRSSTLVMMDNPCTFGRGRKGYVLRTPGKKNKNWLQHADISKNEKGGGAICQPSTLTYERGLDLHSAGGRVGTQYLATALQGVNHNLSMTQQDLAVVKMLNVSTGMFTQNCNLQNA